MGVVLDRHSLYSFQNSEKARLRRRFTTSLSVEAIFDPKVGEVVSQFDVFIVQGQIFLPAGILPLLT